MIYPEGFAPLFKALVQKQPAAIKTVLPCRDVFQMETGNVYMCHMEKTN